MTEPTPEERAANIARSIGHLIGDAMNLDGIAVGEELNILEKRIAYTIAEAVAAERERLVSWADELRDRIRDIYLNTSREAMNRSDVAGREIASAEKECRIRHEPTIRARGKEADDDNAR